VVLDINIGSASATITIVDAFRHDLDDTISSIERFAEEQDADVSSLYFRGLIPQMIRGVVGCERGCPADAKELISRGYKGFQLQYVEGGILTASAATQDGRPVHIKMFPDF
jgi:hypothetical protein